MQASESTQRIFSPIFQHDSEQLLYKNDLSGISQKIFLGPNTHFWPNCAPKLFKPTYQDLTLQYYRAQ